MGAPRAAPPSKLVCAVMHRPSAEPDAILTRLAGLFGQVELRGESFPFNGTRYYEREMGTGLAKFLVSFEGLMAQDHLPAAKAATNVLEAETAAPDGGRLFNLDPGLVTLHNVVLATTKGYSHRLYVCGGIWEEVTLLWNAGRYEPLPWTYPDYRDPAVLAFLGAVRDHLKRTCAEVDRSCPPQGAEEGSGRTAVL